MSDANWDNINRLLDEIESAKTMREHGAFLHNLCKQQQIVVAERDAEIDALNKKVADLRTIVSGLHDAIALKDDEIARLRQQVATREADVRQLQKQLNEAGQIVRSGEAERKALRQQVAELAQNYHADMMGLREAADREIEGLYAELMSAKNLLAFIDEISPASAAQVFEPGLTFTEACRRRMMIIVENEEHREE